jgi:hypothetical protein
MSISNLDYTSYNYLSNLAVVNANEVNTDILTKSDPDIIDLQFDMLEGINTNETIQFWRARELASYQVEIIYCQY